MKHSDETPEIAVVYLSYLPYGIQPLQHFIASLKQYEAGKVYSQYIVFKDGSIEQINEAKDWLKEAGIFYRELHFSGGLDINAYQFAATQIQATYLLFFNTRSQLLHSNWLLSFYNALHSNKKMGAVGATGNWLSYYQLAWQTAFSAFKSRSSISHYFIMLKLAVKALVLYKRWFPPFPNPHLRTNAFMTRRETMLQLKPLPLLQKKIQAYRFESGYDSFTRQLAKMGYEVSIIDKNGKVYLPSEWQGSNTFWVNEQENLLVSDNQTQQYKDADLAGKATMTANAWKK